MNQHVALAQLARDAEALDTLCGDDERLFADMVEGSTDAVQIVTRVHEQIARDEEMLVGIAARLEALRERQGRIKARVQGGKVFIGKALRAALLTKLELPEVTYSVRSGRPGLTVVDPDAVPEELCRFKREPDKSKINEAFTDAPELPNWLVREIPRDVVTARTK